MTTSPPPPGEPPPSDAPASPADRPPGERAPADRPSADRPPGERAPADRPSADRPPGDRTPAGDAASPARVAAGLARVGPHTRELLDLSLHRRVPDDTLGRLYRTDGPEIARRRAAAIQELAAELGVERGTELGRVLNALLESETWEAAGEPAGAEQQEGEVPAGVAEPPADAGAPPPEPPPPEAGPVPGGTTPEGAHRGSRRGRWPLVAAAALAAVAVAAGALAGRNGDGEAQRAQPSAGTAQPRTFVPRPGALGAPFPSSPQPARGHLTATIDRPAALRARPGGRRLVTLRAKTEFGSARVLGVVRRRGPWLAVQASELPNRRLGWLRADQAKLGQVPFAVRVDLSSRRLTVRREGRDVRRMTVTVGGARTPTPTGRFSVTDRLLVKDPASPYGCCVLALTGHQTRLPPGWPGGDRLAVHANRDPATLGQARSFGCLRADPGQAHWLVDKIPLGTPVFIRA